MYENVEHIPVSRFAGEMQEFPLDDRRVLINPGSVGQPRDGDRRAAYAVYDTGGKGKIEFYRVEYPVDETIDKLEALCDPEREGDTNLTSMVDVLVQRLREAG
jgi:diadenosine tetraphosphatase ApaH/serine/threonine PP2A family protein phosphatase